MHPEETPSTGDDYPDNKDGIILNSKLNNIIRNMKIGGKITNTNIMTTGSENIAIDQIKTLFNKNGTINEKPETLY